MRIQKYFCKRFCSKLVWRSFCDYKSQNYCKPNGDLQWVISDLTAEETVGTFYEKNVKKTNEKEFGV